MIEWTIGNILLLLVVGTICFGFLWSIIFSNNRTDTNRENE